ncbi:hypothetical protein [Flavilitoribacter nigricans]|uniref:Uncharacterized protein n=1 Tax=Flavilitoribacter nigricans (strain ATCC 23147 / DSM 23189 / NBRC 102662 / NCIMB 1420 / SS-2) TaxID=1122177 RepID=A0A2D0NCB4_FLAN2|nr:hypothetical protein [Flavilitoribacter nigricans]PHN06020.1 hypothetical protein CRP01_13705 [Flavilitoribacter nigricans DSM 23189 = NBRC 102662]
MENTRLWQSLDDLSAREKNALRKFVASPYFNQRADLQLLLDTLLAFMDKGQIPDQAAIWSILFPDQDFQQTQFRLLMTYLQRLLEQFIIVEASLAESGSGRQKLVEFWSQKGNGDLHQKALLRAERSLAKGTVRNADYYLSRYRLSAERYRLNYRQRPEAGKEQQSVDWDFNVAFIAMKLRQSCLLLAHEQVYERGYTSTLLEPLFAYIREYGLLEIPCTAIYWHGIQMLQNPAQEQHFQSFKKLLLEASNQFPEDEVRDLYLLAINYGIRQVNDGRPNFFYDIMDFYKDGIRHGYLLDNGKLSRFTYHNIVSVALQIDQADWAEQFIAEWTPFIERAYRERMESFNQAKIAYYRQQYQDAIPLLQRSNYHDPLLNLGARTLLLKIYFELEEFEALHSHLDAFQTYLVRKPELGYHRANYRHLIHYTRKMLGLIPGDSQARENLRQRISQEKILTEKEWLLKQIGKA